MVQSLGVYRQKTYFFKIFSKGFAWKPPNFAHVLSFDDLENEVLLDVGLLVIREC